MSNQRAGWTLVYLLAAGVLALVAYHIVHQKPPDPTIFGALLAAIGTLSGLLLKADKPAEEKPKLKDGASDGP